MNTQELPKIYAPEEIERKWYKIWLDSGYFQAKVNNDKLPYCIVIPPPNVTDKLHMGHAYNNTIQDIFIRFHRMQGYETLWLPGTDHAGIATQNVVERHLKQKEHKTRHDIGREKFVERVWEWKEKHGNIIIDQLKKIGCSCDWSRERFTMDEELSRAVIEVFCSLYEKGLIYRGEYIINWCPRCTTALSDEEAIHEDHEGKLWYIRYPVKDTEKSIVVATTRPETMLGDVAVAVNPNDTRYKKLVGKTAILPILEREIPIIADEYVDSKFGTGAVKITPAHDPNDFEIGRRHNLKPINVMNTDGTMNENAGMFKDYDRFRCRDALVKQLESQKLLEKTEKHQHAIAHCQRCSTLVEPYLSKQWFVKIKPLAEPAMKVVQEGKITFHPSKWIKVYINWMENIRDWCISRQLWWGHRIPVYYCRDCDNMMVRREAPQRCDSCGSSNIKQDEDVLDTWFSSWLWPFSTLGWPEKTPELRYFYPTHTLVTAADIIFFWVARMIMAGIEFMDEVPFRKVYFNGIIRDEQGQKMSKSLGNGIDPLEMVEKYSADAVRFSLMILSAEGQDINLSESKFEIGRNFSNKLWNAFRFLRLSINENDIENAFKESFKHDLASLESSDRWILSRYHRIVLDITGNIESFRLNEAIEKLYGFFWHEYCDWYLELIKPRLYGEDKTARDLAICIGVYVLRGISKLLHPFIPFITEEIWHHIKMQHEPDLIVSQWPEYEESFIDDENEKSLLLVQELISAIRNIRGEMNVPPNKKAKLVIKTTEQKIAESSQIYIQKLAQIDEIVIGPAVSKPKFSATTVIRNMELFIPLEGLIDIDLERTRLSKEIDRLEAQIESADKKLMNNDFLAKAPQDVIDREKKKKDDFKEILVKFKNNLQSLIDN
ncbi:valine--tRNA ligase [candidate division KSB1 bacterium]|nr:valine--tRNA ligase [candidate division KSB1 bacterium]